MANAHRLSELTVDPWFIFEFTDLGGWDKSSIISVIRKQQVENGRFVPYRDRFFRVVGQKFHCHYHSGRIVEFALRENEHSPNLANCSVVLNDILSLCQRQRGWEFMKTYALEPEGSITIRVQKYPKQDKVLGRLGANKLKKVHAYSGHEFEVKFFVDSVLCLSCGQSFRGCEEQGLQCRFCMCIIHKSCEDQPVSRCPAHQENSHDFRASLVKSLKKCSVDNKVIFGCFMPVQKCERCSLVIHASCANNVTQLCSPHEEATNKLANVAIDDDYTTELNPDYQYLPPEVLPDPAAADRHQHFPQWLLTPYNLHNFHLVCLLGRGSFGNVFLARYLGDETWDIPAGQMPKVFAIKTVRKDRIAENIEVTRIERRVLQRSSKSPFLLHLLCTFQDADHLFYVTDFVGGGALIFHIRNAPHGKLNVDQARFYAAETICALEFLHDLHIIYRDLKSENVMLDNLGHVRLIDFGLARDEICQDRLAKTICGTTTHMAPEIVRGQPYYFSADWWSFGVFLYEMLVGYYPFPSNAELVYLTLNNLHALSEQYSDASLPSYDAIEDRDAIALLKLLFDVNPDTRLGSKNCPAGSVRKQPFFQSLNWPSLARRQCTPPAVVPPFRRRHVHLACSCLCTGSCSCRHDNSEPVDVSYFESEFIMDDVQLSSMAPDMAGAMAQMFHGFDLNNVDYQAEFKDISNEIESPLQ